MNPPDAPALRRDVVDAIVGAGVGSVGFSAVGPFDDVRRSLEQRKAAGHHAGMSFTFKNPARSTDPARLLRNAATMVVGAHAYLEPTPPRPGGAAARVARYAWRDHYAALRRGLDAGADVLRAAGYRATVVADQNGLVDRAAAHRAGLGWWGRNANLLVPGAGSWFVLGSIITDAVIPPDDTVVEDGCRTCTRCIDRCPTGAISDRGVIDARRCLAWLVQDVGVIPRAYRVALGDRIYGCDDCQDACPPGRRTVAALGRSGDQADDRSGATAARDGSAPSAVGASVADVPVTLSSGRGPRSSPPDAWVDVLDLLDCDDDALLARFGRWYIPRRQARYLRRNALVVLGNVGDGADPEHRAALERALRDPDELLRAHAVWACARLGLDTLVAGAVDDTSALVRAEVAVAPAVDPAPGALPARPTAMMAR